MKKITPILLFFLILVACSKEKSVINYVDPFIGTGFHGHVYPGATVPFGAVQLSPDTRQGNWDACAGYHYSDSSIIGFSHTHLSGTGCIDLGDILFHPGYDEPTLGGDGTIYSPIPFSHKKENASPGYYGVELDNDIKVELTATQRVGVHKYQFKKENTHFIIVDLKHALDQETIVESSLQYISPTEIRGMRRTNGWVANQYVYFVASFSQPVADYYFVSDNNKAINKDTISGTNLQAVLSFAPEEKTLTVKVALSSVSMDNASENLQKEASDLTFEQIKQNAEKLWENQLSKIKVEGGSDKDKTIFYTALYRSLVVPNVISDTNGEYRGADMQIRNNKGLPVYSTFSLWDTFRAWNPMITVLDTTLVNQMIQSFLLFYDQTGELPVWPLASGETGTMIGYHAVSVIYDAYSKGIRGFDTEKALQAMVESANKSKKSAVHFKEVGYIPTDSKRESVSCMLENCYDDWCIAMMAKDLNNDVVYNEFKERAQIYKQVFDGNTSFFRGRRTDGNWEEKFDPFQVGRSYTEATAWQYRFFVPQDVRNMIDLFGGKEAFESALDSLFTASSEIKGSMSDITGLIGQYAHGNEPSHHIAYLYNYIGKPWKTQELTRRILKEMYDNTPEGIIGNEDCGQMSAWYILSSIGLYQVCPGSAEFTLTTPLFDKVTLTLPNGKTLEITSNNPAKNLYVKNIAFNGEQINGNFISYSKLMEGGVLSFDLQNTPNQDRGTNMEGYSFSTEDEVSVPYVKKDLAFFDKEVVVDMGCQTPGAVIRYTLDGSEPNDNSTIYSQPFSVSSSCIIKMKAFKGGIKPSITSIVNAAQTIYKKQDAGSLTSNGVNYKYYKGVFSKVADMQSSPVVKTGILNNITLDAADQPDHFGFAFDGYIFVKEQGIYSFYTTSDDGSVLYIGNTLVVNNDGSHGAVRATGKIALDPGYHSFKLLYFEDYEGESLKWGWRKNEEEKYRDINPEMLFVK